MVSPQGVHHSSDAKWCSRHHTAKEQWSNRPQLNTKIMQIECRTTSVLDCYAEMQLILYKDNHIILTLKRQFIMTKETKENVQIVSAIAMLIGGFLLAVAGFIVPPTGQIHESVLGVFAECLIYAGSIFGVTIYIQTKYAELRSYLDDKLKRKEEKDAQD